MLQTFFININDAIFAAWSVSYVLAESLEAQGMHLIIQLLWATFIQTNYYSNIFSPNHPVDEFSFKGMRMWGQPMISSCCLCVRWENCRENWELGGRGGAGEGSPRFTLSGELLCRPSKSYRKLLDRVAFLQQQWSYSVKICGALLGDWTNGGYADGLLHVWWVGFSTLGSWSYSEEWVWMSWTKLCSTVREVKCQQGSFPKIQY